MGSTRNKRMNSIIRGERPEDRGERRGTEGQEDRDLEELETPELYEVVSSSLKAADEAVAEIARRSASRSATADVRAVEEA